MAHSTEPLEVDASDLGRPHAGWRLKMYSVIFESDSRTGRLFDVVLIGVILASVAVVILDSIASVHARFGATLHAFEWFFTLAFSIEYVARLSSVRRPWRYATSFFGIVDLLAVLPTYIATFVPGLHALIDVRVLRLIRVFRIFKLCAYVLEFGALARAVTAARRKILVFVGFVAMVMLVMGTLMYVVEGPANGFTSIPMGVYWAVTTMTTVGFGDITPKTDLGRMIASVMMRLGLGDACRADGHRQRRVRGPIDAP